MKHRLFPIPLLGKDTSEVESLSSYVHRIAYEHGIYIGELLRYAYSHAIDEVGGSEVYPDVPKYIKTGVLVRASATSKMYVDLFKVLTCHDSQQGIFWFLDGAVSDTTGELVKGFKWCPECFYEMEKFGNQPYFKLIWHLSCVTNCHLHRTPLLEKCTFCGCDQTSYIKKQPIAFCQSCGVKLSKRKQRLKTSDISHSWEVTGSDINQLFQDIANNPNEIITLNGMRKSLDSMFDYYWSKQREEELYQIMSRDKLLAVIYGQRNVSLKMARRFAYKMGLSLFDLLSGNAHQATAVLNSEWICELPPSFMLADKREKHNHRAILRKINKVLVNLKEPPSLKCLAEKVDVSVGYLDYRHPLLAKSVVKEHQEFVDRMQQKKLYRAQSVALNFFNDEKYGKVNKSRKQAYRVLREETGLPKFMLKKAIQDAYAALL